MAHPTRVLGLVLVHPTSTTAGVMEQIKVMFVMQQQLFAKISFQDNYLQKYPSGAIICKISFQGSYLLNILPGQLFAKIFFKDKYLQKYPSMAIISKNKLPGQIFAKIFFQGNYFQNILPG